MNRAARRAHRPSQAAREIVAGVAAPTTVSVGVEGEQVVLRQHGAATPGAVATVRLSDDEAEKVAGWLRQAARAVRGES